MPDRIAPYPSYKYLVDLKTSRKPDQPLGGFSDVSGLKTEIHISEYRDRQRQISPRPQISGCAHRRRRDPKKGGQELPTSRNQNHWPKDSALPPTVPLVAVIKYVPQK